MDPYECIVTKLDIREFASKPIPQELKMKILDAGRLTGSGINVQHWRFILVQESDRLKKLADDSTTGNWVENANFAIIVLTNPKYGFHLLDAGRAVQNMQLAAWSFGIASCIYTGIDQTAMQEDFSIPKDMNPSAIVGFGYPARTIVGRKNRKPLRELAFVGRYGNAID